MMRGLRVMGALATVTAVLAFGFNPGIATAQQSGPIRLAPLPPPTQRSPDTVVQETPFQPGGVVVEGLDSLSDDALGILGDESGGQ